MTPSPEQLAHSMYGLIEELFPICRSITGNGMRQTLERLGREIPLEIVEVASGTQVFDWTVPREWNIRDAYIKNQRGERVVDFRASNLHVVSYSVPVHRSMTLAELRPHLFSLPERPDWIPYRTSYYQESWGFCLADNVLQGLADETYEVFIDSTLQPGSLTYAEYLIPGGQRDEILFSCHACHPSLANDNLSGVALAVTLARYVAAEARKYSYRFLFIPGTIGSITWLAQNRAAAGRIRAGLVLSCVGDSGPLTYKRSRQGNALIDRAAEHVLQQSGQSHRVLDFVPYGYDERQYCSPGFNLPVGCFMRTPNGQYEEYHTSADNLALVRPEELAESYSKCIDIIDVLEHDNRYVNCSPHCEPQLGRRGLYRNAGGHSSLPGYEMALLWVLNFSDGKHSLLEIAGRAQLPFRVIARAAHDLLVSELLAPVSVPDLALAT